MFKDGSMKPVIIAFLAINAILIAYSFPYLVFAYENRNLNGYGIHYDAEPVRVESDTITFDDKLKNMTMVMDNYSYVLVNDESINSGDFTVNLDRTKAFDHAVDAFIDIFMDAEYLKELGMNKRGVKTELSSDFEHYVNMYLIIRPDTEDMYLAWDIIIYYGTGNVEMIIDDETGKLMSMAVYGYDDVMLEDMFKSDYFDANLGQRMAEYYDMKYVDSEYSRLVTITNDRTDDATHVARTVKFMGDDPDEEIKLSYILRLEQNDNFTVYFNYFSYSTIGVDLNEDVESDTVLEYNTVVGDDAMKDEQTNQNFIPDNSKNESPEDQSVTVDTASYTDAMDEQSSEVKVDDYSTEDSKSGDSKSGDSKSGDSKPEETKSNEQKHE